MNEHIEEDLFAMLDSETNERFSLEFLSSPFFPCISLQFNSFQA